MEPRSRKDLAEDAARDYEDARSSADVIVRVLDRELPRYAEALTRLQASTARH